MGLMREYDRNGGCGDRMCRKGGCDERGVEKEVVGDCWGWSAWNGRVRVEGSYRLHIHTRWYTFGTTARYVWQQNVGTAK